MSTDQENAPHVLLVSEIFPPQTGGSGRWFWEIYQRLPRDRAAVIAGLFEGHESFDASTELPIQRMDLSMPDWGVWSWRGLSRYWRSTRALRRIARSRGITKLHAARCLPEGWMAWMLRKATGTEYIVYVHGEDVETAATSREYRWMTRRVFADAEMLVANSHNSAEILRNRWHVPSDKIQVLHPGADTRRFVPAARDAQQREWLGWGDRPVILTVGRLQQRKGHDQMILAIKDILGRIPDVLYAIIGDGDRRAPLEALVAREGLCNHVQFLGEVPDETLIRCYQQSDLFVLPNRRIGDDIEGFGMVLVEAQACGKPVIAGASGGTAETMHVNRTGCIVACETPDRLAQTAAELLLDNERRSEMGRAARRWACVQFSWERLSREARRLFAYETNH